MKKLSILLLLSLLTACSSAAELPTAQEVSPNVSTNEVSAIPQIVQPPVPQENPENNPLPIPTGEIVPTTTHDETPALFPPPEKMNQVASEAAQYNTIIQFYQDSLHQREVDMEIAINELCIRIADEIGIDSEIEYSGNINEAWRLWCSCVDTRLSNLGYAIYDINNDGIPELIILSDYFFIHAIFSFIDNKPILVGAFWTRSPCAIDGDGTLYIHESSGAADNNSALYNMIPGTAELQLIEMVGIESHDEQAGEIFMEARCYRIQNGNKTIISYEEALAFWEQFPDLFTNSPTKYLGLVFIPLFT